MPVIIRTPIRRLSQAEFGEIAYTVMGHVFQIHSELGRFFDEKIYKRELARRCPGVQLEIPFEITHATFSKTHYLDMLVNGGGPFEFKAVEALTPRHPAQLLHYLLLANLGHGKLVNLRNESVEHEFVNTTLTREDRTCFRIEDSRWKQSVPGAQCFGDHLIAILRDWGTGLDIQLYEEALTHLLGGEAHVLANVEVRSAGQTLGHQKMRMASRRVAFTLTALHQAAPEFETHTSRLLEHMDLDAILWANISLKLVTLTTLF